jgi:3-deoxy-D-manno-octulosonic-acid transferase
MTRIWFGCYHLLTILCLPFVVLGAAVHVLFKWECLRPYLQKFSLILPEAAPKTEKRVWIHGVSVGEVISCGPLIELFEKNGITVYLSTSTQMAFLTAQRRYPTVKLLYFPFDFFCSCKRVLRRIKPDAVLLCEVEIWPAFIRTVKAHDVPLYLISGRLSTKDFRSYRRFRFFFRHVLPLFDALLMQSDVDAMRMSALCNHKNIKTLGSLKFDVVLTPSDRAEIRELLPDGFLICAASTHKGEEESILAAFKRLHDRHPDIKLAIAPRHLDRVRDIIRLVRRQDLELSLRSSNRKCTAPVFVIDTMGELAGVFSRCDLVIMGGSLSRKLGGHNVIEPSLHKKCVLCGRYMRNFEDIFAMYRRENALVLTSLETLFQDLEALMEDQEKAQQVAENAFRLIQKNRGAARRIFGEVMLKRSE